MERACVTRARILSTAQFSRTKKYRIHYGTCCVNYLNYRRFEFFRNFICFRDINSAMPIDLIWSAFLLVRQFDVRVCTDNDINSVKIVNTNTIFNSNEINRRIK